jgi:hypothetical protein
MTSGMIRTLTLLLLLLPAAASAVEPEPVLAAAELVEPALLTGPGYRVQSRVELHGLQARFWLDTDWGAFAVDSVELLALRIDELPALEALYAEGITDALSDTGIDAVLKPLQTTLALASDPLGSAVRLPAGVLRYLGGRWHKLEDRARKLGDRVDRALFHDGAPNEQQSDTGSAAADRADSPRPWWDKPVDELGRLLRSQAGHGKARREIAAAFGVDPWTGNPLLRARLDQLAWAVAGGRMASEQLIGALSAGTASALSSLATAAELSADAPAADPRRAAAERLQQWTADDDLIYALVWRGAFPPPRLQRLLDGIDALAPSGGAEALLEAAYLADNELEARFVLNALDMLLHLDQQPVRGGRLLAAGQLIGYLAGDGEFLLPLPVDRLSWTAEVEAWFENAQISDHPRRSVLVAGAISELAARNLTRRGWSLRPYQRWPDAPPYRQPRDAA